MKKRKLGILGVVMVLLISTLVVPSIPALAQETQTIKVLNGRGVSVPFGELERQFEALNPNVDVQLESHDSVTAIRQITEFGKNADVLASTDFSIIQTMMYPDFADWNVRFAADDMVLAYNRHTSVYFDEITPDNWYEILQRDDVTFGFSNPNLSPCGYRALMVSQLAESYYGDSKIFDELILKNTAITISDEKDGAYLIKTPDQLYPNVDKIVIKPEEVELISLVERGEADYSFIYRSVAVQHGFSFVDLPDQIDLSKFQYADDYQKVKLKTSDGDIKTGTPIIYGITVPKNADNAELGLEFVKFVISETGQKVFLDVGQSPIVPSVGSGNIPEELES